MKRKSKVVVEKVEIIEIPPEHRKLADELMEALSDAIRKYREKDAIIEKKLKARKKKAKDDYR